MSRAGARRSRRRVPRRLGRGVGSLPGGGSVVTRRRRRRGRGRRMLARPPAGSDRAACRLRRESRSANDRDLLGERPAATTGEAGDAVGDAIRVAEQLEGVHPRVVPAEPAQHLRAQPQRLAQAAADQHASRSRRRGRCRRWRRPGRACRGGRARPAGRAPRGGGRGRRASGRCRRAAVRRAGARSTSSRISASATAPCFMPAVVDVARAGSR